MIFVPHPPADTWHIFAFDDNMYSLTLLDLSSNFAPPTSESMSFFENQAYCIDFARTYTSFMDRNLIMNQVNVFQALNESSICVVQ